MLRNRLLLLLALLPIAAACDNVGRAFDPSIDPTGPGNETGESPIQVVPVGGDVRDGRPLVRRVYPEGSGWPTTVPVVVEFSESINRVSIFPTSQNGTDGRIGVRARGTGQLLPAEYDLLGGGKLLVIRPIAPLPNEGFPIYEVVLFPESRDVDGLRFDVGGDEEVLADFQVNQGEAIDDGAVLAVFPRDNFDEQPRENDFFVVFDKPANLSTLVAANLSLQPAGGAPIQADIGTPLSTLGIGDPRVVRLRPDADLDASQRYEFTVTEDITFGQSGKLEFNGATPFSVFDTVAPAPPTQVQLASPQVGFENRLNTGNLTTVQLEVTLPADAQAGDTVVARIYGGDASTTAGFDEAFIERSATVAAAGSVLVDFADALGTAASPLLDEGELTFVAQLRRGADRSGFIHNDSGAGPVLDVTPPTLVSVGAPGSGDDAYTDGEWLALYGVASEALAAATLDDAVGPAASLFGASNGGRFLLQPLSLGRLAANRSYTLTLTDASGNAAATTFTGDLIQRGAVTGALAGAVTVQVFDQATLLPVADATVLLDPATPTVPATGQLVGTTDQSGVATFSSALPAHTVTVVHPDYDLVTLMDTQAASVSLPLRATTAATASFTGTLLFEPAAGVTAIVGSTAVADRSVMGTQTSSSAASSIPSIDLVPNRAQLLTGFAGGFEPTATPTYASSGCQMLGPTLIDPTAPPPPIAADGAGDANFVLIPVPPVVSPVPATDPSLLAPAQVDFGLATGLDTADLVGGAPRARCTLAVQGFVGQVLFGVGFATVNAGAVYDVNANYSLPILTGLTPFAPLPWLVSEAEDGAGRVARTRALMVPTSQVVLPGPAPMPIPVVTAGTFTGSPSVSFDDVVDRATVIGGLGLTDLTLTDGSGRAWLVLVPDLDDATGQNTAQLPDLDASPNPGLSPGDWTTVAESRVFLSTDGSTNDDLVLTERFRQEVTYSRSAAATLTVN